MTTQKTTDMPANVQSAAEDEVKSIKQAKEEISLTQREVSKNRPDDGARARDSTGINPQDREPIDSRMPEMPPA